MLAAPDRHCTSQVRQHQARSDLRKLGYQYPSTRHHGKRKPWGRMGGVPGESMRRVSLSSRTDFRCLQVPLSNLAHLRSGEITESQLQPNLERMTTIGFSLLGAPRKSLDRRSAVDAFKDVHSPYGLEGNFHLDLGPVRAVYQVSPSSSLVRPPHSLDASRLTTSHSYLPSANPFQHLRSASNLPLPSKPGLLPSSDRTPTSSPTGPLPEL